MNAVPYVCSAVAVVAAAVLLTLLVVALLGSVRRVRAAIVELRTSMNRPAALLRTRLVDLGAHRRGGPRVALPAAGETEETSWEL